MEVAILGLSLGSRSVGITVIENNKLIDWHLRSYNSRQSEKKLYIILQSISQIIERNRIRTVVVKHPDKIPTGKKFSQLMGSVNALLEQKGMQSHYYTLSDLKTRICKDDTVTKESLTECLLKRYPDLYLLYHPNSIAKTEYYSKVFEAIGAIVCYLGRYQ